MDNSDIVIKAIALAKSRLRDCHVQIHEYAEADEHLNDFHRDEYLEEASNAIRSKTVEAFAALRVIFELLGLKSSLKALEAEFSATSKTMGKVQYFDEYLAPHTDAVDLISSRLHLLTPLFETPTAIREQQGILHQILTQVPQYVEGVGHSPCREKDLQDTLDVVLRLPFPDLIREPYIPKQTKTYHPDFGIESIETALEIKFVKNKKKSKEVLGELYEDMKGYSNSRYSLFVALIYMTSNFLTQAQVEAEWEKVASPKDWKVHVVTGVGGKI